MTNRPNIVLIIADQWRGDCLSIAGHPVVHTPFLDKLAIQGARFQHAYSATPTCIAARAALFTGLSQKTHGRVGYMDGVPWDYPVTLAGEFTRHGYQTQAIGKMHVYPERTQLGFQNVILHDGFLHFARRGDRDMGLVDDYLPWLEGQLGRKADYFEHGVNCNAIVARPWDKEESLHPTNFVVSQSIDFLRRRDPRKPFFLYMSFHRPHPPYDPPAWALEMYLHQPMPEPPVGDWVDLLQEFADPGNPEAFVDGSVPTHRLNRARAGYYGSMTHIDHQINRLVESLQMYGLHENTIILFTADHGEMLGDHNLFRKGYAYEGSAHIPLILYAPPSFGIRKRGNPSPVVELRDIMPTLLDCAGLPIPETVEGYSFLPAARGEDIPQAGIPAKGDGRLREYLHGEHTVLKGSMHWLTDGKEKYIWFSLNGREQLFNLEDDPTECHDLAQDDSCQDRVAFWRSRLMAELAGREEHFTDGKQLFAGRPVSPVLSHL